MDAEQLFSLGGILALVHFVLCWMDFVHMPRVKFWLEAVERVGLPPTNPFADDDRQETPLCSEVSSDSEEEVR